MSEITTLYDSVTHKPGLGDSGRLVRIIEKQCEICFYDRMVEHKRVLPELPNEYEYYCQNPNCPDYHDGELSIP